MGQELACRLTVGNQTAAVTALLESDHIAFRGGKRPKIRFQDLTSVTAADGVLTLAFAGGPAALELGAAAEKWAHKILHPPSRLDKLGVKPGLAIALEGELEPAFLNEIGPLAGPKAKADLLFFAAASAGELSRTGKLAARVKPDGALWIVYPKGVQAVREIDVLEAGRAAGLKDVKVASFSATHTALKFVLPLRDR